MKGYKNGIKTKVYEDRSEFEGEFIIKAQKRNNFVSHDNKENSKNTENMDNRKKFVRQGRGIIHISNREYYFGD